MIYYVGIVYIYYHAKFEAPILKNVPVIDIFVKCANLSRRRRRKNTFILVRCKNKYNKSDDIRDPPSLLEETAVEIEVKAKLQDV